MVLHPAGGCSERSVPQRPVPLSSDADILNVLRPVPEIEIALEGGIRLAYNSWLLGHPPAIRIYGAPEHTESVLIDGKEGGRIRTGWLHGSGLGRRGRPPSLVQHHQQELLAGAL